MEKKETISKQEASDQVQSMITRTALIHYAFVKTLIDEMGEKKGKEVAKKAVRLYGKLVGQRVKDRTLCRKLPLTKENFQDDLPALGWPLREAVEADGEKRAESIIAAWPKSGRNWGPRTWAESTVSWIRPSTRPITRNWNASTSKMSWRGTLTANSRCEKKRNRHNIDPLNYPVISSVSLKYPNV